MPRFNVQASYHATTRYEAEFTVEARTRKEAREKAYQLVEESKGDNTDLIEWEDAYCEGDGDYQVEVWEAVED
jgi:hypothetical protein